AQILRTIALGQSPLAVTVDEARHHVLVATGGLWYSGYAVTPGTVSLLDARSGTVLRSVVVGAGEHAIALDERAADAVVSNSNDGTVSVLDARTGAVVHTVAVGAHPGALAADERTGHVFVANRDDNSVS